MSLLTCLSMLLAILRTCKKGPFPSFWPGISYETALEKAALSILSDRQAILCIKFIGKVRPGYSLYPLIHDRVVPISYQFVSKIREF